MKKIIVFSVITLLLLAGISAYFIAKDNEKRRIEVEKQKQKAEHQMSENENDKSKIKYIEPKFMLGKDLKAKNIYPNALKIDKGSVSIRLVEGVKESISQLLIVNYDENAEYMWSSKNPEIAECSDGAIITNKTGNTQIILSTKSGEELIKVDLTVYQDMHSRIVRTLELPASVYYPTVTLAGQYIYVGTSEGITKVQAKAHYFYKLDTDLNILWQYELGNLETRGSAVLDSLGNIYFVVHDRKKTNVLAQSNTQPMGDKGDYFFVTTYLYSLTPDGKFRFSKEISYKTINQSYGQINCSIDKNNTIYVADCRLFAFSTEGNIKWQFPKKENEFMISRSSPVFDGEGNMYLPMSKYDPFNHHDKSDGYSGNMVYGTSLYSFSPNSNGLPRWSVEVENKVSMPPVSFNYNYSKLYLPLNKTINCFNPKNGKLLWKYSLENIQGEFRANAAVDENENIYIGTKADGLSTLYAIKADGSGMLWKQDLGGDIYTSAVLGDDKKIYITSEASYKGSFYVIDIKTGEIHWTLSGNEKGYEGGGYPRLKDGYIYLASGKTILKIKADAINYFEKAGWPTFRGSNENTGSRAN